jgi:hypothetical protein
VKEGGGATRFKQHLAARGSSVIHCKSVPLEVQQYFQCDLERARKVTTDRMRERLRRDEAAAA